MEQDALIASITWLAVLSPGADFAMVSRTSCLYGRGAGLATSTGIAAACWIHIIYAIFGLALIERIFPNLLDVIKVLGAAYLVYIGVTTTFKTVVPAAERSTGSRSLAREMTNGVLTNGLNPKTSIFVISLYSQVIGRDTSVALQLAWGLFISLSHLAWFALVAFFLSQPRVRAVVLARQKTFNVVIGLVLAALGAALLSMAHIGARS